MNTNEEITAIKEQNGIYYIQNKYINKEFWDKKLINVFGDYKVENITDFEVNTCFTYLVSFNNTEFNIGTEDFDAYIMGNNTAYIMELIISTLSPLVAVHFIKYERDDSDIKVEYKDMPFTEEQKNVFNEICKFAQKYRLSLVADDDLMEVTKHGDLEQTVYCHYFNQEEEKFPYINE